MVPLIWTEFSYCVKLVDRAPYEKPSHYSKEKNEQKLTHFEIVFSKEQIFVLLMCGLYALDCKKYGLAQAD